MCSEACLTFWDEWSMMVVVEGVVQRVVVVGSIRRSPMTLVNGVGHWKFVGRRTQSDGLFTLLFSSCYFRMWYITTCSINLDKSTLAKFQSPLLLKRTLCQKHITYVFNKQTSSPNKKVVLYDSCFKITMFIFSNHCRN